MQNIIENFRLAFSELRFVGRDLHRPESVIAERDGTLWVSDSRGIVTRIDTDGEQTVLGDAGQEPNGLAMDVLGNLYNANIGDGRVYQMGRDGSSEVILERIDGQPLGGHPTLSSSTAGIVSGFPFRRGGPAGSKPAAIPGPRLQLPASVTFAGEDLRTVYMGSLGMPHLVSSRSPVPGLPMRHWR